MFFFLIIAPLTFLVGTALGSFLNVVILRYPKSPAQGRSKCPGCDKTLSGWELIPIISFIFLRARCSKCQKRISVQYPIIEFIMGISVLILLTPLLPIIPFSFFIAILNICIIALLLVLFMIDLRTFILPDLFIILLIIFTVIKTTLMHTTLTFSLWGIAVGAGFLILLWLITKGRGLGIGDIKLMVPLGILFGPSGTGILLMSSFITGGLISIGLLLTHKATMKTAVPFGPFLTGVAMLYIFMPDLPKIILSWLIG
jgi:leader peptidase (prepilin peptidase)/N-methyltransferase